MKVASWTIGAATIAWAGSAGAFDEVAGGHRQITDTGAGPAWEFSAAALWESMYLSEGRDNLDGDSLFSAQLEAGIRDFKGSLWLAKSPESSYREAQFELTHQWASGRWTVEAGGAFLWFPESSEGDQEVGVRVAYELAGGWEAHWHLYHSFDAGGVYQKAEIVSTGWDVGPVELTAGVGIGFNGGYIADGHRGLDHLGATVEALLPLSETWSMVGRLVYSDALGRDVARRTGDANLYEGFQIGIGVIAMF